MGSGEVEEPGLESRLLPESSSIATSRKFCLSVKCSVGIHYMSRFKSPARALFMFPREGTRPRPPSCRLRGPLLGFGKGLCILSVAG